jgi:hypothetical protein
VTRVGRNDPCPCGSGKKYKNCCLNKDRAQRLRESAWQRQEQVTVEKLLAFAQRPTYQRQLSVAFDLFWNGRYGVEGWNLLDQGEISRFLDWYMQDYRLEQSRKRIIDLFLEEMGTALLPDELERVRIWSDSYISLYRITNVQPDRISLLDVFQDTEETTVGDSLGQLGLAGDLLLGRLLHTSQPAHFSWAAILLPAAVEVDLVSPLMRAYEQHRERYVEASWPSFLSQSAYLLNHQLLRLGAETVGAKKSRAQYYDATDTVEQLREAERRLREKAERRAEELEREQGQQDEEEEVSLRKTRGGILLPGHVEYKGSIELKR